MVKHIVLFTLAEEADGRTAEENALEIRRRLEGLNGKLPGLIRLEVGIDFSRTEASADLAVYAEFADREALDLYQQHPAHVEVADMVARVRTGRQLVDYEV